MSRAVACVALVLAGVVACSRADADNKPAASAPVDSTRLAAARAAVEQRYRAHFAGDQGFSDDRLRERRDWFTPALYDLMHEDFALGAAQCGVGFIDFDPFTNAQDDASGYSVKQAHASHDTVYVPVVLSYPGGQQSGIALGMVDASGGWRIANFVHADWDLAAKLRESNAEARKTPPAKCDEPDSAGADSTKPDSTRSDTSGHAP